MSRPELQPFAAISDRPELSKSDLKVFEINRFRGEIKEVEDELAAARDLVVRKEVQLKTLVQKWRDAGLLGR